MASHILAIYMCPRHILKKITSSLTKFWWASSSAKEVLFANKLQGGLGMKDVENLNKALLARQGWRMNANPHLLVSRVFRGKYGNDPIQLSADDKNSL